MVQSTSFVPDFPTSEVSDWLPPGKRAAVCFTVDDIHPRSPEIFVGHDRTSGALGHLHWLLERHDQLRITLFTTPDWRQVSPFPSRPWLARIPMLRDRVQPFQTLPPETMCLRCHPRFVQQLKEMPRTEIGMHGLHHVHLGRGTPVEFAGLSESECRRMLRDAVAIFTDAGLDYVPGMTPPGWELSENLARAMIDVGLQFVASARDIRTPVSPRALAEMSGLRNVSLIYPQFICGSSLVHLTTNFQATSPIDRAFEIVECGGLIAVKAHSLKHVPGHTALDGLDELYRNYLDVVFTKLAETYGATLWWTSMSEIAARCMNGRVAVPVELRA